MFEKIHAVGPWVLIRVTPRQEVSSGGIYLPEGNLQERLSHSRGTVLSVGKGKISKKGIRITTGVEVGDKVVFRGYLKEANRVYRFDDRRCFIHMDDIVGYYVPEYSEGIVSECGRHKLVDNDTTKDPTLPPRRWERIDASGV